MHFDVFFSISQTPVAGHQPDEASMLRLFFEELEAADALGYEIAWVAEAHLSSQVQKRTRHAVVPHWQGEIGLNVDSVQLASAMLARTRRIEVGSAVSNLLVNGGPIALAERVAAFASLHGLDPAERRRLHLGFSAGRFEFMSRAHGIVPRNAVEEAAWPALKGQIYREAGEILCRLLAGEELSSENVDPTILTRAHFRSDADWARVLAAAGHGGDRVHIDRRWDFEVLQIVPREWRRELVQLVAGTHDPEVQEHFNRFLPVRVFNLSITPPPVIEQTHARLGRAYHPDGGPWRRDYMPRTTMVFLDDTVQAAQDRARAALGAYWTALEGTIDPMKVANATDNALVGDAETVARQVVERFHPDDRLMLWFDFFDHDAGRVIRQMERFQADVAPRVAEAVR